jgi:peptide deformylase
MQLPIIALGNSILRTKSKLVKANDVGLETLIKGMKESLTITRGVGLAAPQVNSALSLFIVDSNVVFDLVSKEEKEELFPSGEGITEIFLNARIINYSEKKWKDNEGCLSIPGIEEMVERSWKITVDYQSEDFSHHIKTFKGYTAKVIQHEFDHTQGILFIDHLSPLKRKLINGKIKRVLAGKVKTDYPIVFKK